MTNILLVKKTSSVTSKQKSLFYHVLAVIALSVVLIYFYLLLVQDLSSIKIYVNQDINVLSANEIEISTKVDLGRQEYFQSHTDTKNQVYTSRLSQSLNICSSEKLKIKKEWSNGRTYFNKSQEIKEYLNTVCNKHNNRKNILCEEEKKGLINVNLTTITLSNLNNDDRLKSMRKGGWWRPDNCKEKKKVAIIIPYRDRSEHLAIFLRHMHPFLQSQQLHYRIFVIEQVDDFKFNRGKLLNVGYNEALKFFPYECFVFHDIDLLPEDNRNVYSCLSSPQHMCVAIDKYNYRLLYEKLFGGVEMFSKQHFQKLNGFSNSFWGWGAEDDNLYSRLKWQKLQLWRQSHEIGKYKMLKHISKGSADPKRKPFLSKSKEHFDTDGLFNLQYEIKDIVEEPYYTQIKVNLRKDKDKMFGVFDYPVQK